MTTTLSALGALLALRRILSTPRLSPIYIRHYNTLTLNSSASKLLLLILLLLLPTLLNNVEATLQIETLTISLCGLLLFAGGVDGVIGHQSVRTESSVDVGVRK
jgi:hypothetical protein